MPCNTALLAAVADCYSMHTHNMLFIPIGILWHPMKMPITCLLIPYWCLLGPCIWWFVKHVLFTVYAWVNWCSPNSLSDGTKMGVLAASWRHPEQDDNTKFFRLKLIKISLSLYNWNSYSWINGISIKVWSLTQGTATFFVWQLKLRTGPEPNLICLDRWWEVYICHRTYTMWQGGFDNMPDINRDDIQLTFICNHTQRFYVHYFSKCRAAKSK